MEVTAIFGPPGTGKTQTLIDIAGEEIKRSSHVLFLSFTRAAAQEAKSRVQSDRVLPSTIHSLAFRALDMNRGSVVDRRRMSEFGKIIGIPVAGYEQNTMEAQQEGDEYLSVLDCARNQLRDVWEVYDEYNRPGQPQRFRAFIEGYRKWKDTYGFHDFTDMLERFVRADLDMDHPVVILDEAQDCSRLQWLAFDQITNNSKRVYVAGDDDQSIFEWSGADPHGMASYLDGRPFAERRVLEQSYRLPLAVHTFASGILDSITKRVSKEFRPRDAAGEVKKFGDGWQAISHSAKIKGEKLILVRDRFTGLSVKEELESQQIPHRMNGGWTVWTGRLAEAIRGITLVNMGEKPSREQEAALAHYVPGTAKNDYSAILGQSWQDVMRERMTVAQMEQYEELDLSRPIEVTLSTIHQAKGREAKTVIVVTTCTERVILNSEANPDAEYRVWYVACTRAKEKLWLCGENHLI